MNNNSVEEVGARAQERRPATRERTGARACTVRAERCMTPQVLGHLPEDPVTFVTMPYVRGTVAISWVVEKRCFGGLVCGYSIFGSLEP